MSSTLSERNKRYVFILYKDYFDTIDYAKDLLMKLVVLKDKDYVVDAFYTNKNEDILYFTSRSSVKRMKVDEFDL